MSHARWIVGGVIALALFLVARRLLAGGGSTSTDEGAGVDTPSSDDIRAALRAIKASHGEAIARNVERIYRLETRNFDSEQFRATNTPGMRAFKPDYPFGWKRRGTVPSDFAALAEMAENAGGPVVAWVAFRRFSKAATYVADFLKDYANNAGRWKATDEHPDVQARYRGAVSNTPSPIVDNL